MEPKMSREPRAIMRVTKDIVGKQIVSWAGEEIGEIKEVMIDSPNSRVTYAILSFGGFLGMGDRLFAVPWVSLSYEVTIDKFRMNVNKELLKDAPGFDKDNWPDMSDPTRISEIYKYYGAETHRADREP
jgi:sporulation protein YlmC with PRC-barrel domain